ncbi:MAG TPA: tRNA (adenosine(37)-N6)-dimethylallyltransferase MiaA [Pseudomonadales bacterium]|nr:tRNA (adenosine(37)-N6)-dimethylallyltransferase MiaA [Pseudomonadales bacterium]
MHPLEADPDGRWPCLWIMGPTASGKTDLALAIAEAIPTDLISVDSALVYRGLDIGAAKPSPALLARHPHALVDIREPSQPYSAADFRRDALAAMDRARSAGRLPLLVGGTMLYFRVLEQGIATMPASDPAVRAALEARADEIGLAALHDELAAVDPEAAERIHPNNPQRIKRALEVHAISGRPISTWWREGAQEEAASAGAAGGLEARFRTLRLALMPADRAALHAAIERRFDAMLDAGLVEEVMALEQRGDLHAELPALRAVGYRQVWSCLQGEIDAVTMRERAIAATRQLARRQLTWLRRWPEVRRIEVQPGRSWSPAEVRDLIDALLAGAAAAPSP